jgi:RHS repeat-associated protein
MKLKTTIQTLAGVLTVALTHLAQARESGTAIPGVGVQPDTYFYTGKPYDKDLSAYVFNYRNYDPQVNRWTTVDPSGFPDGANASIYGYNSPTYILDENGLTGKSIALVYWAGSFDGNPGGLFNNWIQQITADMNLKDSAAGSRTNYLSDGDKLISSTIVTNTVEGIASAPTGYKKIILISHGWWNGNSYYWGLATPPYHAPSEVPGNVYFSSCFDGKSPRPVTNAEGTITVAGMHDPISKFVKDYLYE